MNAKPSPSHIVHSGFNDLINLVASTPSRLSVSIAPNSRGIRSTASRLTSSGGKRHKKSRDRGRTGESRPDEGLIGVRYEQVRARANVDPNDPRNKKWGTKMTTPVETKAIRDTGSSRGGRAGGLARGGRAGAVGARDQWKDGELRRIKVDKRMIGPPTDFRWVWSTLT